MAAFMPILGENGPLKILQFRTAAIKMFKPFSMSVKNHLTDDTDGATDTDTRARACVLTIHPFKVIILQVFLYL